MEPTRKGPIPTSDLVSVVIDTNAPSYTGMRYFTFNGNAANYRCGGVLINSGGAGFNSINGAAGGFGVTSYEIEFDVFGTQCAIMFQNYSTDDLMITVDGQQWTPEWYHMPGAGVSFAKFTFGTRPNSRDVHRIRFISGMGLVQILTPATGYIWPAPPRFKCAIIGDSTAHGGTTLAGAIAAGHFGGELALQTGWEIWNLAQGGTGYSNPGAGGGASIYGSSARLAALAALPAMDAVMVYGGANDGSISTFPIVNTVANANAMWTAIKAARPNTPLIVWGIESGVYLGDFANLNALNTALKAAAIAHPAVEVYIDERVGTTYPGQWITGTGKEGAWTLDGNADFVTATDGVHPNHYGNRDIHVYRAVKELSRVPLAA